MELVTTFNWNDLTRIRDWVLDEVGGNEVWKDAVGRAIVDEKGGIFDRKGKERLLMGMMALSTLSTADSGELLEICKHKVLYGISAYKLDELGENMYFEFSFLPREYPS